MSQQNVLFVFFLELCSVAATISEMARLLSVAVLALWMLSFLADGHPVSSRRTLFDASSGPEPTLHLSTYIVSVNVPQHTGEAVVNLVPDNSTFKDLPDGVQLKARIVDFPMFGKLYQMQADGRKGRDFYTSKVTIVEDQAFMVLYQQLVDGVGTPFDRFRFVIEATYPADGQEEAPVEVSEVAIAVVNVMPIYTGTVTDVVVMNWNWVLLLAGFSFCFLAVRYVKMEGRQPAQTPTTPTATFKSQ